MSSWERIAVLTIVGAFVLVLWLGRYELESAGSGPGVFRLDRWTGTVTLYAASGSREIQPER